MAKVSKKFVDETFWPEFEEISDTLKSYLSDVTNRVISEVIHQDSSEAEVVSEPPQLPRRTTPPPPEVKVDTAVPMVMKMFERRLRGYRAIGYTREEAPLGFASPPEEPTIEWDEEVLRDIEEQEL